MAEQDYFKEEFKYYKSRSPPPSFDQVTDFETEISRSPVLKINKIVSSTSVKREPCNICETLGLKDHKSWELYSLKEYDGFLFLKNPFTVPGQQMWIQKCLESYTRKPSITNLDAHYPNLDDIWNSSLGLNFDYLSRLCWATLGYHHNWDTKVYDPEQECDIPTCLKQLTKHIAECLSFNGFEPEAAIINYYKIRSNLGIHNDHSEENLNAPIISLSLGQTAIFLLGTKVKSDKPVPMFLRSGDVVIMSGASRLAYHAVPCIIRGGTQHRYYASQDEKWGDFKEYIDRSRINVSVRQVYNPKTEDIC